MPASKAPTRRSSLSTRARRPGRAGTLWPASSSTNVRDTVSQLQANGVVFEEYDMPGMKTEDGVVTMGDTRAAWLKDPDGNILEIVGD
jgi:hypothetical protein